MKKLNILTIYDLFAKLAETSEGEFVINTFAILKDNSKINTDNLEKTIEYLTTSSKLFFSRRWNDNENSKEKIQWSYPALIINQNFIDVKNMFEKKGERIYKIELFVLANDEDGTPFELLDYQTERTLISFVQRFASCYEAGGTWHLPSVENTKTVTSRMLNNIVSRKESSIERIQENLTNTNATGVMTTFMVKVPNTLC